MSDLVDSNAQHNWIFLRLSNGCFMVYLQYFNQILTVVLEVLDGSDSSVRELTLSLIVEMLKNQVRTLKPFFQTTHISTFHCIFLPMYKTFLGFQ